MNTAVYRIMLLCVLALPWTVQADDATEFTTASTSQQAVLLETWAAAPVPHRLPLLDALQQNRLGSDSAKTP